MDRFKGLFALLCLFVSAVFQHGVAAQERVDLQLVLAVDVSSSMDEQERALQRRGYEAAFRSPEVIAAIQSGPRGSIAVTYFEWSGTNAQQLIVPWSRISDEASSFAFSRLLETITPRKHDTTSISGAMAFAERLLVESPLVGDRQVLDISGDGPNNQGPQVDLMRNELVQKGITINGLPLLMKPHEHHRLGIRSMDEYYKSCVIGGSGAFTVTARTWEEFPRALKKKLVLEIANLSPRKNKARLLLASNRNICANPG
ncbi:MAG: DUF1194 domain-containing protein [Pseudomonadota bacterium]